MIEGEEEFTNYTRCTHWTHCTQDTKCSHYNYFTHYQHSSHNTHLKHGHQILKKNADNTTKKSVNIAYESKWMPIKIEHFLMLWKVNLLQQSSQ